MSSLIRKIIFLALLWLVAGMASAGPCREQAFSGNQYLVCSFDLAETDIRLFWLNGDGQPYRTFSALADDLANGGEELVFAMNGGMYQRDFTPLGLYIEAGRELRSLNTASIEGNPAQIPNFYKKPNGVFYFGGDHAGVMETGQFQQQQPDHLYATQSGPMLVIDGEIHPVFIVDSNARNVRNGVGITDARVVHFVMTNNRMSFHDFALFFRDYLGCDNALYLDGGSAPGIYSPALFRNDLPGHGGYGPIIGVVE